MFNDFKDYKEKLGREDITIEHWNGALKTIALAYLGETKKAEKLIENQLIRKVAFDLKAADEVMSEKLNLEGFKYTLIADGLELLMREKDERIKHLEEKLAENIEINLN